VGFLATFGVTLYELRNTQLYDAVLQRLRTLEGRLGFQATRIPKEDGGLGGPHLERPRRSLSFFFLDVIHDRGLGLVYGAALGGWAYVVADSVLRIPMLTKWLRDELGIMLAFLIFGFTVWQFRQIDQKLDRKLPDDVAGQLKTPDAQRD
jgi:hypothetical protein